MANKLFKDTAKTYYTFSQKTLRSTKQNDLKALKLKQKILQNWQNDQINSGGIGKLLITLFFYHNLIGIKVTFYLFFLMRGLQNLCSNYSINLTFSNLKNNFSPSHNKIPHVVIQFTKSLLY